MRSNPGSSGSPGGTRISMLLVNRSPTVPHLVDDPAAPTFFAQLKRQGPSATHQKRPGWHTNCFCDAGFAHAIAAGNPPEARMQALSKQGTDRCSAVETRDVLDQCLIHRGWWEHKRRNRLPSPLDMSAISRPLSPIVRQMKLPSSGPDRVTTGVPQREALVRWET